MGRKKSQGKKLLFGWQAILGSLSLHKTRVPTVRWTRYPCWDTSQPGGADWSWRHHCCKSSDGLHHGHWSREFSSAFSSAGSTWLTLTLPGWGECLQGLSASSRCQWCVGSQWHSIACLHTSVGVCSLMDPHTRSNLYLLDNVKITPWTSEYVGAFVAFSNLFS